MTNGDRMNKNALLSIAGIALLLLSVGAIVLLDESPLTDLRMTLLSDRIQEADYEETVTYDIYVRNVGKYNRNPRLELTGVPEHWDASLSKEYLVLSGNSRTIVTLSVTAPSVNSAGARGLARVANIGVRAGNVTIGTITILKGSATVLRNGIISPLSTGDDILSGDIVTTRGSSVVSLKVSKLFSNIGDASKIYLLLHDAVVGFLRYEDTAYLWIMSGNVIVRVPGGGGTGATTPLTVNLSGIPIINAEFPGREYNAVLTITQDFEEAFFFLNVTPEGTNVEVYEGEVELRNDDDGRTIERYEQATGKRTGMIPESTCLERTIVMLESDGCVEGTVYYQGTNVLELPDTYHLPIDTHYLPAGKREYYITPILPDLKLNLTGVTDGTYTATFTTISGCSSRSFTFTSTGSRSTTDTFLFFANELKLRNMKPEKYDLTISYENVNTGYSTDFQAVKIKTSDEDQGFEVEDWKKLRDEEEKPVVISQGDKKARASTRITGDELEELFAPREEEEKISILVVIAAVFIIVILVGIVAYYTLREQEKQGKGKGPGITEEKKEEVSQWLEELEHEEMREEQERPEDIQVPKTLPSLVIEIPQVGEGKEIPFEEEGWPGKPREGIFPKVIKCPSCTKTVKVSVYGTYRCKNCHAFFYVNEDGFIRKLG